jgi:hypothetical protein
MSRTTTTTVACALSVAALAVPLTACGSAGKPAYCQSASALQDSIKDLGDIDVKAEGVGAVKTQLQKVQQDAQALVSSAQSDFPDQTQAIRTAAERMRTSLEKLSANPDAANVTAVGTDVRGFVSAVDDFTQAAGSSC